MDNLKEDVIENFDECYRAAEQKAATYYHKLYQLLTKETYISTLTKDFQLWKKDHINTFPLTSIFRSRKESMSEYRYYIRYLRATGKLDRYLHRSISYIFLRDLGKKLDSNDTQDRIISLVDQFEQYLATSTATKQNETEMFGITWLYRWAQKEGIETTIIWLINKLKIVSSQIPKGMDGMHAKRKLIKVIAGVIMHVIEDMGDSVSSEERSVKLDQSIRLGYSYGLTYPFIDDLLDSHVLTDHEKRRYSDMIRRTLMSGTVPEMGEWTGPNKELIRFIHTELKEAFEYIDARQHPDYKIKFSEQAYIFFHSQEVDREKDISNPTYTNEELFIPVILKSSFSRLMAKSVIGDPSNHEFENRTFFYGLYNQLADDFADMYDDLKEGSVTPYTYYYKYHKTRKDLINPFELYWVVISYLLHNVYHSDSNTREVIISRAINGLKRFRNRVGTSKYNEIMELFALDNSKFHRLIQKMVSKAVDVDFFDKLLRDQIINNFRNEEKTGDQFLKTMDAVRSQLNSELTITNNPATPFLKEPIIAAANDSLAGDGKRLRPILAWEMGVNVYGLDSDVIIPLLKSLEYMHTASLIFDDLPSQDNASVRRGRPTIHSKYNVAIAELTGLFLTQRAIWEQASLDKYDPKIVLQLIRYSTRVTEEMCKGQAMDLESKGKLLTREQLDMMSFYKTGLAFEACLIMPSILAEVKESEKDALKRYAYHAGIAFQIKDDLLDVEGNLLTLGKPHGKDAENNNTTFVSILGLDGARKEMWEHYCLAIEVLEKVPRNTTFLKQLLEFFVHRDH